MGEIGLPCPALHCNGWIDRTACAVMPCHATPCHAPGLWLATQPPCQPPYSPPALSPLPPFLPTALQVMPWNDRTVFFSP